jgi:opacity protein-like surface antigen
MRFRNGFPMVLTLCLVTVIPISVRAETVILVRDREPYSRRHFYLGAEAVGVAVVGQTGPRDFIAHGGGFNLFLGGRVHRHVALEFGWQPTFHSWDGRPFASGDGLALTALTFDAKFFPIGGPIQPYVSAGVGSYLLSDDRLSLYAEGGGYQLGAGVDFWLGRHFSLGLKAQYRGVGLVNFDRNGNNSYLSLFTAAGNFTARF